MTRTHGPSQLENKMLPVGEVSEAEVRREDQLLINEFGRSNMRLHLLRDEIKEFNVRSNCALPIVLHLQAPTRRAPRLHPLIPGALYPDRLAPCRPRSRTLAMQRTRLR